MLSASVFLILGLLSIIVKTKLGATHWSYPYLDQLPGVFLVSGTLSLMHKVLEEREQDKRLRDLFGIHESVVRTGLTEILSESQGYNFTDLLERSSKFAVVMNDGNRWAGNYAVKLRERFEREGTVTEIFLVDPDSDFAGVLAGKIATTKPALAEKIRATRKLLEDSHAEAGKKGVLRVYALKNFPALSVFHSDDCTVLTPYQTAAGRATVPVFIFKKQPGRSFYAFVENDLSRLREESAQVYPAQAA